MTRTSTRTGNACSSACSPGIFTIQDSTVPAHVVPVFHSSGDRFEKAPLLLNPDELHVRAASYFALNRTFAPGDILSMTAAETIENINRNIPGVACPITWRKAFWDYSADGEWGCYGALGNTFGASKTNSTVCGAMHIPPETCNEFANIQHRNAVIHTIQLLDYAINSIAKKKGRV